MEQIKNPLKKYLPRQEKKTEIEEELMNEFVDGIVKFTGSKKSRKYYELVYQLIGEDQIRQAVSEVKAIQIDGKIRDIDKYFIARLKSKLKELCIEVPKKRTKTAILNDIGEFAEMESKKLQKEKLNHLEYFMPIPYGDKHLQSPRFVSQDFFTLPQDKNKDKFDEIKTRITIKGQAVGCTMLRGKQDKLDRPRGMLTTEHARILGALEQMWVTQGCKFKKDSEGNSFCTCTAEARDIAKLIGINSFGGTELKSIVEKVLDLNKTGYYLETEMDNKMIGYGFQLVGDISLLTVRNPDGQSQIRERRTTFNVIFSEVYSRFLLSRKSVSRPLEMLKIRNEIAFKLYMYLFPRLMKTDEFMINLISLVSELNLPKAGWHQENRRRKAMFKNAIQHLNGKTINSKKMICAVETKNKIHFLKARLT